MTREEINNELDRAFEVLVHCGHMDMRRREAFYMAIEALSAESCEDAISRQAVLDAIRKSRFLVDAKQIIDDLPSVTPKQRWIPVSEKLPESDEEYHTFLVTDSKGRVALSEFYLSVSDGNPYWSGMIDVLAWMPLPDPYRAESEDK